MVKKVYGLSIARVQVGFGLPACRWYSRQAGLAGVNVRY